MYYNKEHKEKVNNRGDGYTYIGSYKCEEIIISAKDLHKAFRTMCESHPRCDCCDYRYGTCEFEWILDNYNVTKKE